MKGVNHIKPILATEIQPISDDAFSVGFELTDVLEMNVSGYIANDLLSTYPPNTYLHPFISNHIGYIPYVLENELDSLIKFLI